MDKERIPIYLPLYVNQNESVCDCRKTELNMEFKVAILHPVAKQGDTVKKRDVLFEGEVEKIIFEVLSPADGTLSEICFNDGDYCGINDPLGYIETFPD